MKTLSAAICALLIAGLHAAAAPSRLSQIQAEMRARQFEKAIELADEALAARDADADHALFLKATALFHGKKFVEAVAAADRLIADFPESGWRHKAVFLKAQAFIEQKKFAEAAAIYEAESARILAPGANRNSSAKSCASPKNSKPSPTRTVPDARRRTSPRPIRSTPRRWPSNCRASSAMASSSARPAPSSRRATPPRQSRISRPISPNTTRHGPAPPDRARRACRCRTRRPPANGWRMARFHLAESFHQSGNPDAARMELEDLLKRIAAPTAGSLALELATAPARTCPRKSAGCTVRTYFALRPEVLTEATAFPSRSSLPAKHRSHSSATPADFPPPTSSSSRSPMAISIRPSRPAATIWRRIRSAAARCAPHG
jgi:tetratricopeptide (TPR) repeat protein